MAQKRTAFGIWAGVRVLMVAGIATACSSATRTGTGAPPAQRQLPPGYPTAYPTTEPGRYTEADVGFMSGMIPHHAQAVLMAAWVPERSAREDVRILAARIIVAQQDEMRLASNWLRERGEAVPNADAAPAMHDGAHRLLMPGMLTADELSQLESARGAAFDRLFLTSMIRHHEGALTMVDQLFDSYGAAQDETVFRFASDVYADQLAEIERMTTMLEELDAG